MRYQINGGGWPIGQYLISATTVIDANASDDWSNLARGRVPLPNATPLDAEAYNAMARAYGSLLAFYGVVAPA